MKKPVTFKHRWIRSGILFKDIVSDQGLYTQLKTRGESYMKKVIGESKFISL